MQSPGGDRQQILGVLAIVREKGGRDRGGYSRGGGYGFNAGALLGKIAGGKSGQHQHEFVSGSAGEVILAAAPAQPLISRFAAGTRSLNFACQDREGGRLPRATRQFRVQLLEQRPCTAKSRLPGFTCSGAFLVSPILVAAACTGPGADA